MSPVDLMSFRDLSIALVKRRTNVMVISDVPVDDHPDRRDSSNMCAKGDPRSLIPMLVQAISVVIGGQVQACDREAAFDIALKHLTRLKENLNET